MIMKMFVPIVLALAAAQGEASAAAEMRAPLRGVSSIRLANYGAPSVLVGAKEEVQPMVEELNELRGRPWRRGETKMSCYSTIVFYGGRKTIGTFRLGPDELVEFLLERGQATYYSHEVDAAALPVLRKKLGDIAPAKNCEGSASPARPAGG